MKIIYKIGDALAGPEDITIHGCNAYGVMGSGIAKQVRVQFPCAYNVYRAEYVKWRDKGMEHIPLGSYTSFYHYPRIIINAITQKSFGGEQGVVYADYAAIRKFFRQFNSDVQHHSNLGKIVEAAMPKIGAGLAGGDWEVISQIIEEESTHFQPVVYIWEDPSNSNTLIERNLISA